jgi:orotate phosphoribosyltransferase
MDVEMSANHPLKKKLLQILKARSYREGEFTLASGKKSNFYLDVKETALDPEGAFLIGTLTVDLMQREGLNPFAVGGLTLGADPLATAVSLAGFANGLKIPAFIVRKEPKGHGTLSSIEGAKTYPKGAKLVILEDTATTGGSALKAVDKVVEAGFHVLAVISVVDREEGARQAIEARGLKFFSLCSLPEIRAENLS